MVYIALLYPKIKLLQSFNYCIFSISLSSGCLASSKPLQSNWTFFMHIYSVSFDTPHIIVKKNFQKQPLIFQNGLWWPPSPAWVSIPFLYYSLQYFASSFIFFWTNMCENVILLIQTNNYNLYSKLFIKGAEK